MENEVCLVTSQKIKNEKKICRDKKLVLSQKGKDEHQAIFVRIYGRFYSFQKLPGQSVYISS